MNDLIEFLTSQEMIVVYIVVGVACFLCFLVYLIDKNYYKRKRKQNTKELNKLVESIDIELEKNPIVPDQVEVIKEELPKNILYVEQETKKVEETPVVEIPKQTSVLIEPVQMPVQPVVVEESKQVPVQPTIIEETKQAPAIAEKIVTKEPIIIKEKQQEMPTIVPIKETKVEDLVLENMEQTEEELQYTSIEPNQNEAQAELRRLTEELQKAQEVTRNIDISSLEEEQEQNAIISLDELMKKSMETHFENNIERYEEDDENKPISLTELEKLRTQVVEKEEVTPIVEETSPVITPFEQVQSIEEVPHQEHMVLDEFNNIKLEEVKPYQESRKFKSSPVISPVYGIENKQLTSDSMELENTANYEKLDEEIKKTNEFLMTLKELQQKLD